MAPGDAAATADWMVRQGFAGLPSLSFPGYAPSTCSVSGSTGIVPQVPSPHGATSRHAVSPGTAIDPNGQGSGGRIGSQPASPSWTKPSPQPSSGTPAGRHVSSRSHSPDGHGMSGGKP